MSYVALPDVRLDGSSDEEAALIRKGVPYLREVFSSKHWRVFKVLDPTPIASAPAVLTGLDHDSFTLRFAAAGHRSCGCTTRATGRSRAAKAA